MYTSETVLESAKIIRSFLPRLLKGDSDRVDQQLSSLIARCMAGELGANEISQLLARDPRTREWMAEFLARNPSITALRSFSPLPGISAPSAPRYECPHGDFVWFRLDSSDPIPTCPTHQVPLILRIVSRSSNSP